MGTGDATKGSAWVLFVAMVGGAVMLCLNALVAALARLVVEIDPRIAFRAHRLVAEHFRLTLRLHEYPRQRPEA